LNVEEFKKRNLQEKNELIKNLIEWYIFINL
jgi:hypothetical protein